MDHGGDARAAEEVSTAGHNGVTQGVQADGTLLIGARLQHLQDLVDQLLAEGVRGGLRLSALCWQSQVQGWQWWWGRESGTGVVVGQRVLHTVNAR